MSRSFVGTDETLIEGFASVVSGPPGRPEPVDPAGVGRGECDGTLVLPVGARVGNTGIMMSGNLTSGVEGCPIPGRGGRMGFLGDMISFLEMCRGGDDAEIRYSAH